MRVEDLCVCDVAACSRDTRLARAASLMRRYDVGSLPILDDDDRVVGIVTDRDIALEIGRGSRSPGEIQVGDIMTEGVATIRLEDDARDALREMGRSRVRRLAVVDEDERLQGILSIDDIICHATEESEELPAREIVEVLARISRPYAAETGSGRAHAGEKPAGDGGRRPRAEGRLQETGRRARNGGRARAR